MTKTLKKDGQQLELIIDWALNTVQYKFSKITGVTMKLTAADLAAIRATIQPDFINLETKLTKKINDVETKLTKKINDVETKLTKKIDNIVKKNKLIV